MREVLINTERVTLPANTSGSLLRFLREVRGLTATKPACTGGDCGACLILLVAPTRDGRPARFKAVNSCLLMPEQVEGCVLITPEALAAPEGGLNPVQQILVEQGAIQCGYCTPGLSIALTAALLNGEALLDAAAGNLCRCTGYGGIRRACAALEKHFPCRPRSLDEAVTAGLLSSAVVSAIQAASAGEVEADEAALMASGDLVAGGTDWSVQHAHRAQTEPAPGLLSHLPQLQGIRLSATCVDLGAAVTVGELQQCQELSRLWPALPGLFEHFASPGIRNSATIGGNLANASPIADLAVLLLALEAELLLHGEKGERGLSLASFYRGYKQTVLEPGETIARVQIPLEPERQLSWEKVCRRPYDDIASVNSALTETVDGNAGRFGRVRISAGGVGPVPLVLHRTAAALEGKPVSVATVRAALGMIADEITPIDDLRGTAGYKAALLRHQVIAHLVRLYPSLPLLALIATEEPRS